MSDESIKGWSRLIFWIMGIGFAGLAVVIVITAIQFGNADPEDIPAIYINLMWIFGAIALGLPLALGAIVGGLAIHRLGWIPLLIMILGLLAVGLAQADGFEYLGLYGWIALGVGFVATFLLAIFRTKVDIWFGLPILNSPRMYVRGGKKDQEDEEEKK